MVFLCVSTDRAEIIMTNIASEIEEITTSFFIATDPLLTEPRLTHSGSRLIKRRLKRDAFVTFGLIAPHINSPTPCCDDSATNGRVVENNV